jgi:uncharacterized membrane protein
MSSKNLTKLNLLFLSLIAASIELAGAVIQTEAMLKSVGVESFLQAVSLSNADKVNFALYLTFTFASIAIMILAGALILKGYVRRGRDAALMAAISGIVTLFLPFALGYTSSLIGLSGMLLGLLIMVLLWHLGSRLKSIEAVERLFLTPVEVALVAVFSALTAVLTGTTGIMLPSPTGGYTHIGDTGIFVSALLFGSRVGGLVGIIGPVVADLLIGYPRWFVTVLAHGMQGFIAGLGRRKNILAQVALLGLSGVVMATTYFFINIFIKGYPLAVISYARDIFGQVLISLILALVLTKAAEKALPSLLR